MKTFLYLQRLWQVHEVMKPGSSKAESCTVGLMTVYKENQAIHTCYTIENGGVSSRASNLDKRIMPGKYLLEETKTFVPLPREWLCRGLLLSDPQDPYFKKRKIFIHAGNYPQDTEGCILVQSTYDTSENPGYGRGSMRATKRLYDLVHELKIDTLIIRDEEDAFNGSAL